MRVLEDDEELIIRTHKRLKSDFMVDQSGSRIQNKI